jgi:hypothetical protein
MIDTRYHADLQAALNDSASSIAGTPEEIMDLCEVAVEDER